jgi:hypothetical protein
MRRVPDLLAGLIKPIAPFRQLWRHRLRAHQQGLGRLLPLGQPGESGTRRHAELRLSGEGTTAFWGLGNNDRQARAEAQSKCESGGDKNCEVKVSRCSY